MEIVKRTSEYTIVKKRNGRYGVQTKKGRKWINADEKVKILLEAGLIKAPEAKPQEAEPEAAEEAVEETASEDAAGEADAPAEDEAGEGENTAEDPEKPAE